MIVAVDVGLKRIGVAFGINNIAIPQMPILRKNRNQASKDLEKILHSVNAKILVVGLPKGFSSEDEMCKRIKHFISLLKFNGEIEYIDESFSSVEASNFYDFNFKNKDGKLDSIAAMVILQRYFKEKST